MTNKKRIAGIEPVCPAWEAGALTTVLYPHICVPFYTYIYVNVKKMRNIYVTFPGLPSLYFLRVSQTAAYAAAYEL